jgi:hypothetical protein
MNHDSGWRTLAVAALLASIPTAAHAQSSQVGPGGTAEGTPFRDDCTVAAVHVHAGWWIDGVQLSCADGRTTPQRGGRGGTRQTFTLPAGARITALSGSHGGSHGSQLYTLRIHTDRGDSELFGGTGGEQGSTPFRIEMPGGSGTFQGIFGTAGEALHSIGLVVGGSTAPLAREREGPASSSTPTGSAPSGTSRT